MEERNRNLLLSMKRVGRQRKLPCLLIQLLWTWNSFQKSIMIYGVKKRKGKESFFSYPGEKITYCSLTLRSPACEGAGSGKMFLEQRENGSGGIVTGVMDQDCLWHMPVALGHRLFHRLPHLRAGMPSSCPCHAHVNNKGKVMYHWSSLSLLSSASLFVSLTYISNMSCALSLMAHCNFSSVTYSCCRYIC